MFSCLSPTLLVITLAMGLTTMSQAASTNVLVGAIRWDAWQENGTVQAAVEKSLGPEHWHYRLPFFSQVNSATNVSFNGNRQSVMDQEINYAANAGIDYWAFVIYDDADGMSHGLHLYLASTIRNRIRFALNLTDNIAGRSESWNTQVARYVSYFTNATYQKVLGNRPLVYIFGAFGHGRFTNNVGASNAIVQLRTATMNAGLGSPYIVFQGFNAASDFTSMKNFGLDAIGAYAVPDGSGTGKLFSAHATKVHSFWEADKATGAEVVPIVSSGWDNRPRAENPVPWTAGGTNYVLQTTPADLTNHLADAIHWTESNLTNATPANTVLIYAWNEHDEGGWICPTLKTNATNAIYMNSIDTSRLDAISTVTRSLNANQNWWSIPGTGITIIVNQPPTAGDATYTRAAGGGVNISVAELLSHVTNVSAGQTISLVSVGSGSQGASIIIGGAVIEYVPAAGNTNSDSFTYTVSDGRGGTATGNININVN